MKKIIYLLIIAISIGGLQSCKKDETSKILARSISINEKDLSLVEGSTKQLTATVLPQETDDKTLIWKSSDASILSVDKAGLISAIKSGETEISVSTSNNILAKIKVIITSKFVNVTDVIITNKETELSVGKTLQITTSVLPIEATDKSLTYKTSDNKLASISKTGEIRALKAGKVTITVISVDGVKEANLKLEIKAAQVEGFKIKSYSHIVKVKGYHRLIATVFPEQAADKSFTWTSSNPEVATIDNEGEIVALSVGKTEMTIQSKANPTVSLTYEINVISENTVMYNLCNQKSIKDGTKPSGSWTYQKVLFKGADSSVDMDYSFEYNYKKAEAILSVYYKESTSAEIKKHNTELYFDEKGFDLLQPIEINGKKLSRINYETSKSKFIIASSGIEGEFDTSINGVPAYSKSENLYKHRLKSGDLQKNYSDKMWTLNENTLDVLGKKRADVNGYKFEIYTYIKPVAYEGQDNMFTVTYYNYETHSTVWHSFQFSGYETASNGSIIFKKDSDITKWYKQDCVSCKNLVENPKTSDLLKIMFSTKGWKVVEEWSASQYVLISNENPEYWFRLWVHYDEDWD